MRKGISLIVLVITIIVIIILTGAIILNLSQNNPINSASEAAFKSNASSYNSELSLYISKMYANNSNFNPFTFEATSWDGVGAATGTVKEYIPSISVEDGKNYIIYRGSLSYIGTDISKVDWAQKAGLRPSIVKSGLVLSLDGLDFKNSPQTTSLIDRSGNNNNATPSGFDYITSSGSDGSGSLVFDGNNDYLSLSPLSLNGTNCSISMFAYITNTSNQVLFASNVGIGVGIYNSSYLILRAGSSDLAKRTANITGININQWNHIVINYDLAGNPTAYFNGKEATYNESATNYWTHQASQFYIGCRNNGTNSYFFNGKIKNVYLYNRVLTETEIKQNYNAGL